MARAARLSPLFTRRPDGTGPEFGVGGVRGGRPGTDPLAGCAPYPSWSSLRLESRAPGGHVEDACDTTATMQVFKWCSCQRVDGCIVPFLLLRGRTLRPTLHYFCGLRIATLGGEEASRLD